MTPKAHAAAPRRIHVTPPLRSRLLTASEITQIRASLARAPESSDIEGCGRADALPLALLCTDIEGFTPMVQRLGDLPARAVIRTHNQLLRTCLQRFSGREVTHTGDGILASFRLVARAIECATAMQVELQRYNRAHRATPLRVRIGLHVGAPLPEEGRLFGSCINVTVRVCGATRCERIYVSDAFRQVADCHPARLLDRGSFALKGIDGPMRLHELIWD